MESVARRVRLLNNNNNNKHPFFVLKTQVGIKVCLTLDSACQLEA